MGEMMGGNAWEKSEGSLYAWSSGLGRMGRIECLEKAGQDWLRTSANTVFSDRQPQGRDEGIRHYRTRRKGGC
jgi:hypothetical protein